jgi:hypothetical protein
MRHIQIEIMKPLAGVAVITAWLGAIAVCNAQDLKANDSQLTSIETLFNQIDTAKADGDKDKFADNLERRLSAYGKAMSAAFNAALRQAELAAKSKGKQGNVEALKTFEDLATKHEQRLKQLDERGKKMKSSSIPATGDRLAFGWRMLDTLGSFIITPAEAAIALNVYGLCHGLNSNSTAAQWAACNRAIANAIGQRSAAQSAFNSCWSSLEGVKPKWWRAVRRAGCTAVYVARLA